MARWSRVVVLGAISCLSSSPVAAQATVAVSYVNGDSRYHLGNSSSTQANENSVTADGRYVAFMSWASNLVPGDTNGFSDVFVRDRLLQITELVSVSSSGVQGNGDSSYNAFSADGRYVAFCSKARNLVSGDTNGHQDVFVRDRQLGITERVSISNTGDQANGDSYDPVLSSDGRFVAFQSEANNLVPGDTNGYTTDIFVFDRQTQTIECVSTGPNGVGNDTSEGPRISGDGRFVAFDSYANNLVPGDTNRFADVFVRDRLAGTLELVSVDSNGSQGNYDSDYAAISSDGRYVAFESGANNLVHADANGSWDIFVRDRTLGTTERISVRSDGTERFGDSTAPAVSADGMYVAFSTTAALDPADGGSYWEVYLRDRLLNKTLWLSRPNYGGDQPDGDSLGSSVSADGGITAFVSWATNFAAPWTGGVSNVFVRDLDSAHFTSFCEPGQGNVLPCPCGNPPSGPGRGCDNSSHTGGAMLFTSSIPFTPNHNSSIAYLSMDGLFLSTSGERPNALSVVLQGSSANHAGLVFGQGVRCVSGLLKRLYTKTASNGGITVPDVYNPADNPISWQSGVRGDVIPPGATRYYVVYYRDPVVLGGCPASHTFNSTQSAAVVWFP